MSDQMKLDLDPKSVLKSVNDMGESFKGLAATLEEALGKQGPKSIDKLEKAAEDGSSKIGKYFSNLGKRLKEDLKSAFDVSSVLAGMKFAKELGEGVKSVFDLEKAFDRLNTRLQLTGKQFMDFKKSVGSAVSKTGQKLEDVFPGVETASAKGGVQSPEQLAAIGGALAKVRAATGESTEALADSVVEILKTQGKRVNAQSFGQTLDALQATRVNGAFKTAGQAGQAIEAISPYGKQMGLDTRQMGGLAATASKSGESGQSILQQLMQQASQPGGMDKLNAVLGVNLFKNGKMDSSQLGKIDTKKFGQFSPQIMEQATGLTGASGADLGRFVDAFKNNMEGFDRVVKGADETAAQFETATDSLSAGVEKFRERAKNAGREVGESLSETAHQLLKGNFSKAGEAALGAAKSANDNKGTIAATMAMTVGASVLMGEGLKGIMKKVPGGKLMGALAGEATAEAMGVQKVFVVNASEMGGGGMGEAAASAASKLAKFGGVAALGAYGAAAGAGVGLGYGAVKGADALTGNKYSSTVGKGGSWLYDMLHPDEIKPTALQKSSAVSGPAAGTEGIAEAVAKGTEKAMSKKGAVQYTNPSSVGGRGGGL